MVEKKFGAFGGVFLPAFLGVIGVIFFLRLGFVVGEAGVLGALAIMALASSVTLATVLAVSSITTNIKIGPGGPYSIIKKTLGLEVSGAVGIPYYFAQVLSLAFYLFGFSEGWHFIYPDHSVFMVVGGAFLFLLLLNLISTKIAVKAQMVVFVIVLGAIISIFVGGGWMDHTMSTPLIGDFAGATFWPLFALTFTAVTGIMGGIGLSGELTNAKKQIPMGILSAWGVITALYVIMIFWLGSAATSQELTGDTLIVLKFAAYAPIVIIGILAATFSGAMTMFLSAPRLLQALADYNIIPFSKYLSKLTAKGEPRNAMIATGVLVSLTFFFGSLNAVAPVMTMFFLIVYATTNMVVFIEQSLGLPSFRPVFKIPKIVTLYGAIASVAFMFLISAIAGVIAMIFLILVYVMLIRQRINPKEGDSRSGVFTMLAEWAARKVAKLPESTTHIWKPNFLVPVMTTATLRGNFPLIRSIVYPHGTMTVLGMEFIKKAKSPEEENFTKEQRQRELRELKILVDKFGRENIFTSYSTVAVNDYTNGICISLEAVEGQVFHPNAIFLPFKPKQLPAKSLKRIYNTAKKHDVGVMFFNRDEDIGLGSEKDIHVWIPDSALEMDFFDKNRSFDLGLLISYTLHRNWNANITLWMCTTKANESIAKTYLDKLLYESRFPEKTRRVVVRKKMVQGIREGPQGDIHIIPISGESAIHTMLNIAKIKGKSFLFVTDSGKEDVLG